MSNPDPILVKAAVIEYNRWANFLHRRPYTTKVVAEFIDEIERALLEIQNHPERYPLEGYSDYRKFGPTARHQFKIIYVVRNGITWVVAIAHPARRMRYWARRILRP